MVYSVLMNNVVKFKINPFRVSVDPWEIENMVLKPIGRVDNWKFLRI
jgi:hypothetical protein